MLVPEGFHLYGTAKCLCDLSHIKMSHTTFCVSAFPLLTDVRGEVLLSMVGFCIYNTPGPGGCSFYVA